MTIQNSTLNRSANAIHPRAQGPDKAWDAAKKFEQTFVSSVLQQLLKNNEEGLFGGGETEVMFRSLLTEKIAESMSFGIAESVYPSLLKGQEVNHDNS